jgi:hypothetical protein
MSVQKPVPFSPEVVVQVGQAEVVRVLVGEDAHAAVLGLDRVVADPVAALADLDAAEQVLIGRAGLADVGVVRVPAVAPDGSSPSSPPPSSSPLPECSDW